MNLIELRISKTLLFIPSHGLRTMGRSIPVDKNYIKKGKIPLWHLLSKHSVTINFGELTLYITKNWAFCPKNWAFSPKIALGGTRSQQDPIQTWWWTLESPCGYGDLGTNTSQLNRYERNLDGSLRGCLLHFFNQLLCRWSWTISLKLLLSFL